MVLDLRTVEALLASRTGLTPSFVSAGTSNALSQWRFDELPRPLGVSIEIKVELGIARAVLQLDTLASGLVNSLNSFAAGNHVMTEKLIDAIDTSRMQVQIRNQGQAVESGRGPFDGSFEINGRVAISEPTEDLVELIDTLVSLFAFMAGEQLDEVEGSFRQEGKAIRAETTRYERSRFNRSLAIRIHGLKCFGCQFDFEEFYGPEGSGIVEIHHLVPVHLMAERRVVDPRTELVPLCSNCHTMVHRTDPPFSIEQLRSFVDRSR